MAYLFIVKNVTHVHTKNILKNSFSSYASLSHSKTYRRIQIFVHCNYNAAAGNWVQTITYNNMTSPYIMFTYIFIL
jgi:hypothetical protein